MEFQHYYLYLVNTISSHIQDIAISTRMNKNQSNQTNFILIDYFSIPLQWNFSICWMDILESLLIMPSLHPVMLFILYFHEQ